ncbi:MAG: peptidylprolyl isomerase [Gammaproteobacteria bacterium]|nr:peptidylprolyl isomerase [Gammaproteobacteria bacterium]
MRNDVKGNHSMALTIKRLCREPLVHFLSIGAVLFVFYDLTRDLGSEAPNRILVSGSQIELLATNFKRTWMRPPTENELNALVENHLREEVFYREALAMGLDQDDPLVRRRMRMKLEFILEDLSAQDVTDEALAGFLQENPDKFRREAQLSFQQVYLNPDKRKATASDVEQLLVSLNGGAAAESVGDATLVPADYSLATQSEIARAFGERFAEDLIKRESGDWIGPIYSGYGAHLVKVSERIDAGQSALADIREWVEREYLVQKRKEQKELAFQRLRENYQITIESLNDKKDARGGVIAAAQAGELQ